METIPMEDREGYLKAMEKLRWQQSIELTAPLQNSVEIKQNSKMDWYIGSIKVYFGNEEHDMRNAIQRLVELKRQTLELL